MFMWVRIFMVGCFWMRIFCGVSLSVVMVNVMVVMSVRFCGIMLVIVVMDVISVGFRAVLCGWERVRD